MTAAKIVLSDALMWRNIRAPYLAALPLVTLLCSCACERSTSSDLQEWSPADHDNQSQPGAGQVNTSQPRPGMPDLEEQGVTEVVLAAWKTNCVRCHGIIGRGDGPNGRVFKPRDLTNPKWQRVALDSEIARTIRRGRGQMPGFSQLPETTVQGLVRLVRMLNAEGAPESSADRPGSTIP